MSKYIVKFTSFCDCITQVVKILERFGFVNIKVEQTTIYHHDNCCSDVCSASKRLQVFGCSRPRFPIVCEQEDGSYDHEVGLARYKDEQKGDSLPKKAVDFVSSFMGLDVESDLVKYAVEKRIVYNPNECVYEQNLRMKGETILKYLFTKQQDGLLNTNINIQDNQNTNGLKYVDVFDLVKYEVSFDGSDTMTNDMNTFDALNIVGRISTISESEVFLATPTHLYEKKVNHNDGFDVEVIRRSKILS